jgi:hypothetical protein
MNETACRSLSAGSYFAAGNNCNWHVSQFRHVFFIRKGLTIILVIPDHKPDAFQLGIKPEKVGDYFVEFFFGGFSRWDAQHFINVAMNGYSSVENFAFFPLYPMMIRVIAGVILRPLAGILSEYYRALLAGCVLSSLCFCFTAVILHRLWMRLTHKISSSSFIIALAIINPATVFFTSCYTESPFFAATLMGIYLLCMENPKPWLASISFSFASALRSNGILNAGFIAHFGVYQILRECSQMPQRRDSHLNFLSNLQNFIKFIQNPLKFFECWLKHSFKYSLLSPHLSSLTFTAGITTVIPNISASFSK